MADRTASDADLIVWLRWEQTATVHCGGCIGLERCCDELRDRCRIPFRFWAATISSFCARFRGVPGSCQGDAGWLTVAGIEGSQLGELGEGRFHGQLLCADLFMAE